MLVYKFNYIKNIQAIFKRENFILAALNMSFLAYFYNRAFTFSKYFIMWPDGIFGEKLLKIRKLPGSLLIKKIILPMHIKELVVLGNLSSKEKKFLILKFKKPLTHINIPISNIKKIINIFKNKSLPKNSLILITLPTPKQEQFAKFLIKEKKCKKIICIGGGLKIACEKKSILGEYLIKYNLEWLYRLRQESVRRFNRLIYTCLVFLYHTFVTKKFKLIFLKCCK